MLYLFNTNIIPDEAVVRVSKITVNEAVELVNSTPANELQSAIGHQG